MFLLPVESNVYFQILFTRQRNKILTYLIFYYLGFYYYMKPNLIQADRVNRSLEDTHTHKKKKLRRQSFGNKKMQD